MHFKCLSEMCVFWISILHSLARVFVICSIWYGGGILNFFKKGRTRGKSVFFLWWELKTGKNVFRSSGSCPFPKLFIFCFRKTSKTDWQRYKHSAFQKIIIWKEQLFPSQSGSSSGPRFNFVNLHHFPKKNSHFFCFQKLNKWPWNDLKAAG